jgi:hypothetical protein
MSVSVMFARFLCMMRCVQSMSVSDVRVVARFFVIACLMMLCSFPVVLRGMFMVYRCIGVVLGALVLRGHIESPWLLRFFGLIL